MSSDSSFRIDTSDPLVVGLGSRGAQEQASHVRNLSHSTSDSSLKRRLRILCLHGYSGSGTIFRNQITHLLSILSDYGDCIFVDAPSLSEGDSGWWHARENGGTVDYEGWERSRAALVRIFNEQGPFDGVLGFSQGAILTSILCGLRHPPGQPPNPECPFRFSFAVMIGGFQARDTNLSTLYDKRELYKIPSLHTFGTADYIVSEADSMKLAERFDEPRIVIHDGGHVVPDTKEFKATLQVFVKEQYENKGIGLDHQGQQASTSPSPSPSAGPHSIQSDNSARHLEHIVIPLWSTPDSLTMRVVSPKNHHTQRSPILVVFRGGGYATPRGSGEGTVEWAAARGFLAVEVDYGTESSKRYYPDNYSDGARAIRLIRSRAESWNANPDRLVLLGYSAGGHLAALLGTRPMMYRHPDDDLFDKFSARPNLLILAYGVLSFVDGYTPTAFSSSVNNFFGPHAEKTLEQRQEFSPEYLVDQETPPTFVWTVEPDDIVPPNHSKLFAEAMRRQGRDVKYKIYKTGYHAIGLAVGAGGDVEEWPNTMLEWMEGHWAIGPLG